MLGVKCWLMSQESEVGKGEELSQREAKCLGGSIFESYTGV